MSSARVLPITSVSAADVAAALGCSSATAYRHLRLAARQSNFGTALLSRVPGSVWEHYVRGAFGCASIRAAAAKKAAAAAARREVAPRVGDTVALLGAAAEGTVTDIWNGRLEVCWIDPAAPAAVVARHRPSELRLVRRAVKT